MPNNSRITRAQFTEAIEASDGTYTDIARRLGIDRTTLLKYRRERPWVQALCDRRRNRPEPIDPYIEAIRASNGTQRDMLRRLGLDDKTFRRRLRSDRRLAEMYHGRRAQEHERRVYRIHNALLESDGRIRAAARALGMAYSTVQKAITTTDELRRWWKP